MTTTTERPKRATKRKRMVRKQIYILPRQDEELKRLAEQRAVSEAELIREAIDELLQEPPTGSASKSLPPNEAAWQALLKSMQERQIDELPGEPHRWVRADYYDDERARKRNGLES